MTSKIMQDISPKMQIFHTPLPFHLPDYPEHLQISSHNFNTKCPVPTLLDGAVYCECFVIQTNMTTNKQTNMTTNKTKQTNKQTTNKHDNKQSETLGLHSSHVKDTNRHNYKATNAGNQQQQLFSCRWGVDRHVCVARHYRRTIKLFNCKAAPQCNFSEAPICTIAHPQAMCRQG